MVEFVGDGMSCITLRGLWGDNIVLKVHIPSEDKMGDVKGNWNV
jgi:hypothetical protein